MSAPDDHPRSLGRFATRIVWSVLGLALAYVLSVGPVAVIGLRFCPARLEDPPASAAKRNACNKAISTFYSPLEGVGRASKTGQLLKYYVGWWAYTFQPKGGYRWLSGNLIYTSPMSSEFVPAFAPSGPPPLPSAPDVSAQEAEGAGRQAGPGGCFGVAFCFSSGEFPRMSAPDDHPRSLGRFATRIVWTVLGLALAYVLSIGPAAVISFRFCLALPGDPPAVVAKRDACAKAIETFYSPLIAISDARQPGSLVEHYVDWWCYTFQPKGGYRFESGLVVFDSPTSYGFVPGPLPSAPASRTFAPDIPRYLSVPFQPPPASPPFALDITPYMSVPSPLPPEPPLFTPNIPLYLSGPTIPPPEPAAP